MYFSQKLSDTQTVVPSSASVKILVQILAETFTKIGLFQTLYMRKVSKHFGKSPAFLIE